MNLSKIEEIFNPALVKGRVHIIGCGSVGSTVAELLARHGITKFTLWDFDFVEAKNIANQMFFNEDIGKPKVDAVKNLICRINPDAEKDVKVEAGGWHGERMRGYVFLAVDSIEIRKEFVQVNKMNPNIQAVFDVRTGLYDAQTRAANWQIPSQVANLEASMDFTHEEAAEATPVSACGVVQGGAPTVRMISCLAVTNFCNFVKSGEIKGFISANPYELSPDGSVMAL